uniref:Uncharacterized protein n=1 Tax=Timema cristinae TaxID=61476 RepID=A0A7R9CQN1_TIMCR|nr:unnamed protein product [Timema cristinae]
MLRGCIAGLLAVWLCCHAESLPPAPEDSENELKLVHVIFRHGERTPANTYPEDPYVNFTFEPVGWGQLINLPYSSVMIRMMNFPRRGTDVSASSSTGGRDKSVLESLPGVLRQESS